MRTYITLAVFIIFAVFSFWLYDDVVNEPAIIKTAEKHFPDYFMENFTITSMNDAGQVAYILKAAKMLHFSDDDTAELEQPFLSFDQDGNKITLNASKAIFSERDNTLILADNVVIHRSASSKQKELSIYTDYLIVNTETQIAKTHTMARVKTPSAELNTLGLRFDNRSGTLLLQSQVKGLYNAIR